MNESVVILHNTSYEKEATIKDQRGRKIIITRSSVAHITITAMDPSAGACVEVLIKKDALPFFIFDYNPSS